MAEDIENLTFEQARAELEDLVSKMESGNMPLEDLITAYERGAKLTAYCRKLLAGLQQRVELIINGHDKGAEKAECTDFAPEANAGDRNLF